jgi:phosphomethylpyrimidine synthase
VDLERDDTEELDGPTSEYGKARLADPALAELRFNLHRKPRRARPARTSRRCTTRGKASSRRKWNTSPSAKTCAARISEQLKTSGPMGQRWPI